MGWLLAAAVSIWLAPPPPDAELPLVDVTEAIRAMLEDERDFVLVPDRESADLNLRLTDFQVSRSTRMMQFGYLDVAGPGLTEQERVYESWRVVGAMQLDGEIHLIIGIDGPRDMARMNAESLAGEFLRELESWCEEHCPQ